MIEKEETVHFNLRLPAKLKERLEQEAREQRRSLNQYIVWILEGSGGGESK